MTTSILAHDPLHPVTDLFPLGRPFGLLSPAAGVTDPEAVPFGLRRAVAGTPIAIGDLSAYGYDHVRQIGTVRDGDRVLPLTRHTDGQTRTTTNPDGYGGPDTDTDHQED